MSGSGVGDSTKPVSPVVPETAKEERFVPPAVKEPEIVALPELEKV